MSARALTVLAATALACAVSALAPAPAAAVVPWQVVVTANTFVPGDITIVEGDSLTLTNADLATHDITALDTGPTGPLFRSAVVGPGKQSAVFGVSDLPPSTYPFYCSLHEFMTGTLTVLAP